MNFVINVHVVIGIHERFLQFKESLLRMFKMQLLLKHQVLCKYFVLLVKCYFKQETFHIVSIKQVFMNV